MEKAAMRVVGQVMVLGGGLVGAVLLLAGVLVESRIEREVMRDFLGIPLEVVYHRVLVVNWEVVLPIAVVVALGAFVWFASTGRKEESS